MPRHAAHTNSESGRRGGLRNGSSPWRDDYGNTVMLAPKALNPPSRPAAGSWWLDVPRDAWGARVAHEVSTRLRGSKEEAAGGFNKGFSASVA